MKHVSIVCRLATAVVTLGCLAAPAPAVAQLPPAPPHLADMPAATAATPEYHLAVGDKLRIEIYKEPQLSQSAEIRPDGRITLPLVGDIAASNQTPSTLRQSITEALTEYVKAPNVTVIVVESAVPSAYVVGEVRQPGAVALQRQVTVLQALALSGGITEYADEDHIRVLRQTPSGIETIQFRYKDALKGVATAQVYLRSGDTVIVP
jgi:polysaccharide export outer membrane protein